jgi:hypothetical protein
MPAFYRIEAATQTIFCELEGAVTDRELLSVAQAVWADPEYRPDYARLLDGTNAAPALLSAEFVRWAANRVSLETPSKVALVANRDAMYGMMRMFQLCFEGAPCQAFRKRDDALVWLGQHGHAATESAALFGTA